MFFLFPGKAAEADQARCSHLIKLFFPQTWAKFSTGTGKKCVQSWKKTTTIQSQPLCAAVVAVPFVASLCFFYSLSSLAHHIIPQTPRLFYPSVCCSMSFFFHFYFNITFRSICLFYMCPTRNTHLGRCWHNVHFNRTAAESRSYLKSRCARRRSEHVCMYVYLFYCCNMVKVQGYDSFVVTYYIRNFTYLIRIYVAFRTNEPASPRDRSFLHDINMILMMHS